MNRSAMVARAKMPPAPTQHRAPPAVQSSQTVPHLLSAILLLRILPDRLPLRRLGPPPVLYLLSLTPLRRIHRALPPLTQIPLPRISVPQPLPHCLEIG